MKNHALFRRHRTRGVAAVEFAFILPMLLVMLFGTTEFGRAMYTYNTLDKAARDAARHLSQHGPGDTTIQAEARCLAVYGNTGCSGAPLAPGLKTANVTVCDALACPGTHASQPTGLGLINVVSVTVTGYAYGSLVQFVMPSITFNDISVTMRSQL
jgi:Flp pilus assembly protein TadG